MRLWGADWRRRGGIPHCSFQRDDARRRWIERWKARRSDVREERKADSMLCNNCQLQGSELKGKQKRKTVARIGEETLKTWGYWGMGEPWCSNYIVV
jgi:hypothetical protein